MQHPLSPSPARGGPPLAPSRTVPAPLPPEFDDERLVDRMSVGDETALATLFDAHAAAVHGLALRMLPLPDEAEDVVEAAFREAWRRADRYDPRRGSVRAWLLALARSRALARRQELAAAGSELPASASPAPRPDGDAADRAVARTRRQLVRATLAALSAEQHLALELAYFDGLSAEAIAARTGRTTTEVHDALAAGCAALQRLLEVLPEAEEAAP